MLVVILKCSPKPASPLRGITSSRDALVDRSGAVVGGWERRWVGVDTDDDPGVVVWGGEDRVHVTVVDAVGVPAVGRLPTEDVGDVGVSGAGDYIRSAGGYEVSSF